MFWGLWAYRDGHTNYYKAYITKMNNTHVDFALEINKGQTRSYPRTKPVLIIDKKPLKEDIIVNSPVIAQHRPNNPEWYRTGTVKGTVKGTSDSASVSVKFDNEKLPKVVRLKNLRLVKRPRFCVDNI